MFSPLFTRAESVLDAAPRRFLPPEPQGDDGDGEGDGHEGEYALDPADGEEEGEIVGREHAADHAGYGFAEAGADAAQFRGILFGDVDLADGHDAGAEEGHERPDEQQHGDGFGGREQEQADDGDDDVQAPDGLAPVLVGQRADDHGASAAEDHHAAGHDDRVGQVEAVSGEDGGHVDHHDVPGDQPGGVHAPRDQRAGEVGRPEQHLPRGAATAAFGFGGLFETAEHVGIDVGVVVFDARALFEAFDEPSHFVMASVLHEPARGFGQAAIEEIDRQDGDAAHDERDAPGDVERKRVDGP